MTNGDKIRSMTDEELAAIIAEDLLDERLHFCQNTPECDEMLDKNIDIPEELCLKCGKYKEAHIGACDGCRWAR